MHNKSEAYQGPKYFSYNGKGVFASGSGSSSDDVRNLFLHINGTPIAQWFKEQFGLGQSETRSKGIRL